MVARMDHSLSFCRFDLQKVDVRDAAIILLFAPKIVPVDGSMGEPKRTMVRVIAFFSGSGFHGPIPCQRQFPRADKRIAKWAGHVLKKHP